MKSRFIQTTTCLVGILAFAICLGLGSPPTASEIAKKGSGREQFHYNLHCLGCHGAEGMGLNDVPPFPGVLGYFLHIPEGRRFIVRVPGVAHSDLTDQEVTDLTNWLLQKYAKAELPPDYKELTVSEVADSRANALIDVDKERARIVSLLRERKIPIP